jgi:hypothetical protein
MSREKAVEVEAFHPGIAKIQVDHQVRALTV